MAVNINNIGIVKIYQKDVPIVNIYKGTELVYSEVGYTNPYSIISYYKLNSNVLDSFGTNNGTAVDVTYGVGKINNAGIFNGSTSKIKAKYSAFDIKGIKQFSMSCWVKPNALPASTKINCVMAIQNSVSNGIFDKAIRINSDGSVTYYVYDGAQKFAISPTGLISIGVWHHLFATFDGTNIKLYINGVLKATTAASSTYTIPNYELVFPYIYGTTFLAFNGLIDECVVYNKPLTQAEITDIYNLGIANTELL